MSKRAGSTSRGTTGPHASGKGVTGRGATGLRISRADRIKHWLARHKFEAQDALKRLTQMPASALMTLSMLAVALAVPGFLLALVMNLEQLSPATELKPQIAVYLTPGTEDTRAEQLSRQLLVRDDLLSVELISPDTGASDFRQQSNLGELLDLFEVNPLPAVILLVPRDDSTAGLQTLQQSLFALPDVETVELDTEWLIRLGAILGSFERISLILSILLSLTVLLVVANTIRMMIASRLDEIEVSLLIGATPAWVRRPFLYAGLWYGAMGGGLAIVLIYLALIMVESPLRELTTLYLGSFELKGLGFQGVTGITLLGALLGWSGAHLAVSRQLSQFEAQ